LPFNRRLIRHFRGIFLAANYFKNFAEVRALYLFNRVYALAHITQHTIHNWSCCTSCDAVSICAAKNTMEYTMLCVLC